MVKDWYQVMIRAFGPWQQLQYPAATLWLQQLKVCSIVIIMSETNTQTQLANYGRERVRQTSCLCFHALQSATSSLRFEGQYRRL